MSDGFLLSHVGRQKRDASTQLVFVLPRRYHPGRYPRPGPCRDCFFVPRPDPDGGGWVTSLLNVSGIECTYSPRNRTERTEKSHPYCCFATVQAPQRVMAGQLSLP